MITEVIRITPAQYARAAMMRLMSQWWWIVAVPMAGFLVGSIWDPAYIIAAVITIFLLLPPIMMVAYYSYLLKPAAAGLALPHRVTIEENGDVIVTFEPNDDTKMPAHEPITLREADRLSTAVKNDRYELYYRRKAPLQVLIIPMNCVGNSGE